MKFGLTDIRNKAYLIIISAFVIGVITGGLLMNLLVSHSLANKRPLTLMDEMTKALDLTPEQCFEVEKIFQETKLHSKEVIKTVQPKLDELRTKARTRIQTVLRSDQQVKYEKWNQRRDAQKFDKH